MEEKRKIKGKGILFWITGLAGSGKIQIAKKIKYQNIYFPAGVWKINIKYQIYNSQPDSEISNIKYIINNYGLALPRGRKHTQKNFLAAPS